MLATRQSHDEPLLDAIRKKLDVLPAYAAVSITQCARELEREYPLNIDDIADLVLIEADRKNLRYIR